VRKSVWILYAVFEEYPVLTPEAWVQDGTQINEAKPLEYGWAGQLIAFLLAAMITATMVFEWMVDAIRTGEVVQIHEFL
jgi:hypothetical protein